jgi:hypothetical protein
VCCVYVGRWAACPKPVDDPLQVGRSLCCSVWPDALSASEAAKLETLPRDCQMIKLAARVNNRGAKVACARAIASQKGVCRSGGVYRGNGGGGSGSCGSGGKAEESKTCGPLSIGWPSAAAAVDGAAKMAVTTPCRPVVGMHAHRRLHPGAVRGAPLR